MSIKVPYLMVSWQFVSDDQAFNMWLVDHKKDETQLRRIYTVLEDQLDRLWDGQSDQSKLHNRYDIDALLVSRLRDIKTALAHLWVASGQVSL